MGDDLCTYRARVGTFCPKCAGIKKNEPLCFASSASFLRKVLPSAHILLVMFCIAQPLICSGDIEANPGPDDTKLDQILEKLNQLTTGIGDLKNRVSKLEGAVGEISALKTDVKRTNEVVTQIEKQIQQVSSKQQEIDGLYCAVDALKNQMRTSNLLIKGIPEEGKESWSWTELIARSFSSDRLQINAGDIERAHRIGQRREGFHRPIIVKLLHFKSKQEILYGASRLKSTDSPRVRLEEDYSPRVRLIRKKLWEFGKSVRTTSDRVNLVFEKLFVNNLMYKYDAETDSVLLISREPIATDAAHVRPQ